MRLEAVAVEKKVDPTEAVGRAYGVTHGPRGFEGLRAEADILCANLESEFRKLGFIRPDVLPQRGAQAASRSCPLASWQQDVILSGINSTSMAALRSSLVQIFLVLDTLGDELESLTRRASEVVN